MGGEGTPCRGLGPVKVPLGFAREEASVSLGMDLGWRRPETATAHPDRLPVGDGGEQGVLGRDRILDGGAGFPALASEDPVTNGGIALTSVGSSHR